MQLDNGQPPPVSVPLDVLAWDGVAEHTRLAAGKGIDLGFNMEESARISGDRRAWIDSYYLPAVD